jgi:HlyD family secretion protein
LGPAAAREGNRRHTFALSFGPGCCRALAREFPGRFCLYDSPGHDESIYSMKKVIALILVLAAAGAGYFYWRVREAKADQPSPQTTTAVIAKGSIFQAVSSTGKVVSNRDVDIKCKASGEVIKLPYDISQDVKQGDLLLEVDPVNQQRAVHLAEVALSESQAHLKQAEQNLVVAQQNIVTGRDKANALVQSATVRAKDAKAKADRRRQLLAKNLGMQEEVDAAETEAAQAAADLASANVQLEEIKTQELALDVKKQDIELAKAEVESDQIALSNAQQNLLDTKVVAPMDGVVSALNIQTGTIISSGITNVGGGTTILTLSDLSHVFVLASVDESDIGHVAVDQDVNITTDAYAGRTFKGKVVRIATKGVNVSNVVTFEVKIEVLDQRKNLLKPEMTANVQIISAQRDDVLTVPAQAVSRKNKETVATVVKADGTNEERPVQVGLTDGEKWELVSGLSEGETVLVRKDEQQSKWRADQARMMGGMGMFPGAGRPGGGGGGRGGGR